MTHREGTILNRCLIPTIFIKGPTERADKKMNHNKHKLLTTQKKR